MPPPTRAELPGASPAPTQAHSTPKITSSRPSSATSGAGSARATRTSSRQGIASWKIPSPNSSPRSCALDLNGQASGSVTSAESAAPINTALSMSGCVAGVCVLSSAAGRARPACCSTV